VWPNKLLQQNAVSLERCGQNKNKIKSYLTALKRNPRRYVLDSIRRDRLLKAPSVSEFLAGYAEH
jgi:hypothetical protein